MTPRNPQQRKGPLSSMQQVVLAMELPFVMIGSVLAGGGLGYLIDRYAHTAPLFMLVGGGLGLAGGIWEIIRDLSPGGKRRQDGNGGNGK
ncbi:MAG TPA: AtpZ/AtpI family protein [Candidatus Acidoferrales bacterium]|nr:AtpZ/AtpI family protein [Candidatus Acidoferrales bacterium]